MLPGPVFNAELMTTARRARYFWIRFVYGIILLYFIWSSDLRYWTWMRSGPDEGYSIHQLAEIGAALFRTFLIVQSIAILLLIPALVAGVIADERQRKTLHYLLATPLSPIEIVLGKLAARMLHVGVLLAVGLPVMSLLSLFGGVDPDVVLLAFAATVSTAFLLSSLSILVSVISRRPREAITLAYLLEAFWLFAPPICKAIMPSAGPFWVSVYEWVKPVNDWIAAASPMSIAFDAGVMLGGGGARLLELVLWMIGLQLAYGMVFLAVALVRLRPSSRNEGGGSVRLARLRRWVRPGHFFPRPECGDDAMMWKERYVSRTSFVTKVATGFVASLTVCGLAVLTYDYARPAFEEVGAYGYGSRGIATGRDAFNRFLRTICTLLYVLWSLALASAASSSLSSEREGDTWVSLVATPLSGLEILRAKMFGTFWGLRWAGLLLASFWLTGLAAGAIDPLGFAAVLIETGVFVGFAVVIGTTFSLHSKSSARALVATLILMIVCNGGYLMCCIPFDGPGNILPALAVTPMIEAISLMSYGDVRTLFDSGSAYSLHGDRGIEALITCVLGTAAYLVAAWVLTVRAIDLFDVVADRPRGRGIPRAPISFLPGDITYLTDDAAEEKDEIAYLPDGIAEENDAGAERGEN